ncbi:MAG: AarF/ABC1/UbiB kinase family protein [Rhodospirillaceae bacterium]|nr:MAG: AarF/ABC1/UbiB kinase family protein [Rhodospirillaceae bacterium]
MAKKRASDDSENTLGGRVRRYANVGTAIGGIATRMASERVFNLKSDRDRNAEALKLALGGLKGPLMKVAQILATIPDALPKEYARELAQLQSNAPRMGWPFVNRRMTAELGADWQSRFADFEREAARAASLGQVHRATGHDHRHLACKLQYPDMDSAVEADLKQLKVLFAAYRRFDSSIDPSEVHAEISARLREELDYTNEAKNLALYRLILAHERGVHVPEVLPELSTRRLLTMTWLEGRPLTDVAAEADQATRDAIAVNMFRAWYVPLYRYGVIHGDPHLGNYSVRPDASVNLMDFGAIRVFGASFVKGVIDLYRAVETGDHELAVAAYETWGFTGLSREMIETLNLWAAFIYAPLLEDRPRLIEETNAIDYGRDTAAKVHTELRRLGGIKPPREFVLMDRAAIGLGSVFMHLRAHVNWYRLFHDTIAGFDAAKLAKTQAAALKKVKLDRLLGGDEKA